MLHAKTTHFEGPLDLLLSLIEQRQLDITKIAIAEVTEQFLQHVKLLENINPSELADYLHIAAKLLVLKSKAVLPTLEIEEDSEEDSVEDLETKLILYKQFKEAAKEIKSLEQRQKQSFTRALTFEEKINFFPDPSISPETLKNSAVSIVKILKELDNLPKAKIREVISIQEKIENLRSHLANKIETKLSEVLSSSKNKGEVIVTFLALLELIKQRIFVANQDNLWGDVTIKRYENIEVNIEEQI